MTRLKAGSLVVSGSVLGVVCLCYFMRVGLVVPGVLALILVLDRIVPLAKTALSLGDVPEDDH